MVLKGMSELQQLIVLHKLYSEQQATDSTNGFQQAKVLDKVS